MINCPTWNCLTWDCTIFNCPTWDCYLLGSIRLCASNKFPFQTSDLCLSWPVLNDWYTTIQPNNHTEIASVLYWDCFELIFTVEVQQKTTSSSKAVQAWYVPPMPYLCYLFKSHFKWSHILDDTNKPSLLDQVSSFRKSFQSTNKEAAPICQLTGAEGCWGAAEVLCQGISLEKYRPFVSQKFVLSILVNDVADFDAVANRFTTSFLLSLWSISFLLSLWIFSLYCFPEIFCFYSLYEIFCFYSLYEIFRFYCLLDGRPFRPSWLLKSAGNIWKLFAKDVQKSKKTNRRRFFVAFSSIENMKKSLKQVWWNRYN